MTLMFPFFLNNPSWSSPYSLRYSAILQTIKGTPSFVGYSLATSWRVEPNMRSCVPPGGEEGLSKKSREDVDEKDSFLFDLGLDIDFRI